MFEIQKFSPETGKPHPVSLREYMLMDRHELQRYVQPLTKKEKFDLARALASYEVQMPISERREISQTRVAKLSKRENKSIGDKIELRLAKLHVTKLSLPERYPIFFRKLRTKPMSIPKLFGEAKSPFLLAPQR